MPARLIITISIVLALGAGPCTWATAQTPDAAVKQTIEAFCKALEARNLELALSYLAEDAQIDSVSRARRSGRRSGAT